MIQDIYIYLSLFHDLIVLYIITTVHVYIYGYFPRISPSKVSSVKLI
jgi:hypothetical protein